MFTTAAFPGRVFKTLAEFTAALSDQKNLRNLLSLEVAEVEVSLEEECSKEVG